MHDLAYYTDNRDKGYVSPDYIEKVVRRLDELDAACIVVDRDLSTPDPGQSVPASMRTELNGLKAALTEIGRRRHVILPITLTAGGASVKPSLLDDLRSGSPDGMIAVGFVNLPMDIRYVPLRVEDYNTGQMIDSIALAIAKT